MIIKSWNWLAGKKTYFLGFFMVGYAIFGTWVGHITSEEARLIALTGLGFLGVRHGLDSAVAKLKK